MALHGLIRHHQMLRDFPVPRVSRGVPGRHDRRSDPEPVSGSGGAVHLRHHRGHLLPCRRSGFRRRKALRRRSRRACRRRAPVSGELPRALWRQGKCLTGGERARPNAPAAEGTSSRLQRSALANAAWQRVLRRHRRVRHAEPRPVNVLGVTPPRSAWPISPRGCRTSRGTRPNCGSRTPTWRRPLRLRRHRRAPAGRRVPAPAPVATAGKP